MFIKRLTISGQRGVIRDMEFRAGLNLILDNTSTEDSKSTGNNVGKTTVLKLIDFCFGGKAKNIYTSTENKKDEYEVVKQYLTDEKILITLLLTEDLADEQANTLEITRNFLSNKQAVRMINGKQVLEKDFENTIEEYVIPEKKATKPTFRQIISHNIRYKNESIDSTLKTLDKFTNDFEYESLYLFLLGCEFGDGARRQALIAKENQERLFKERLEKKQTRNRYEIMLGLLDEEISQLNVRKSSFNINDNLEDDLEQLNLVKYRINNISALISKLKIRKDLIEESKLELERSICDVDVQQLRSLYGEATLHIAGIQKTFEDLVAYHNNMVIEKVKYISRELPELEVRLDRAHKEVAELLVQEKTLTDRIAKGDSFEELEKVISELNEKYRTKGEYESVLSQYDEVEENISALQAEIQDIDRNLFSEDFESIVKKQVSKFNKLFSSVSYELYGEKYVLEYKRQKRKGQEREYYKFDCFNANMSSGKKQGEILCFDLAYILFADAERISCLHFLLNDKKELMHDNQLLKVAEFVQDKNIQLVISILKDKLPPTILNKAHVVVELSQNDKLFRIENQKE